MSYQSTGESAPLLTSTFNPQSPQQQHSHHHLQQQHHHHHHPLTTTLQQQQPGLSQVRAAYQSRDILSSIELHNQRTAISGESHDQAAHQSHYVGQISSTIQGVLTTMVLIQTAFAAQIAFPIIFILVLANGLANGFGFSSNEALQTISERLFVEGEAAREQWELEVNLKGEVDEMVALYVEKGTPRDVAEEIWNSYAKDPKIFLEAMMAAEIGVIYPLPPLDTKKLLRNRYVAFLIGVVIPVLHFAPLWALSKWITFDRQFYAIFSFMVSLAALFYLGSQRNKGYPITSQSESVKLNNGLQSLFCGIICAAVGFLVGKLSLYIPQGSV